jgi:diacylglycerol kinase (ATP)
MDGNVSWHSKLKRAPRSILIVLHNQTGRMIHRIRASLRLGTWIHPPPNFIDVGQKIEFGARSSMSNQLSGVSAFLRFEIVPPLEPNVNVIQEVSNENSSDNQVKGHQQEMSVFVSKSKVHDTQRNPASLQSETTSPKLNKEHIFNSLSKENEEKQDEETREEEIQPTAYDNIIELLLSNNPQSPSTYIVYSLSKDFRVISTVIRGAHARITVTIQQKFVTNNNSFDLNRDVDTPLFDQKQSETETKITSSRLNDESLISWDCPVLVFVNKKSGGHQGKSLLEKFKEFVPPDRIVDIIAEKSPKKKLEEFRLHSNLRILACGGDGTGKWIMETMDTIDYKPFPAPPVGILPLGTGNDIARVLGWGGGYNEGEPLLPILNHIVEAEVINLDRWSVERIPYDPVTKQTIGPPVKNVMNNYLALGFADAKIALDFHRLRDAKPGLFFDRKINKFWYLSYGARAIIADVLSPETSLHYLIKLYVNEKKISLKEHRLQGLIILNLPSYAAGRNIWGTRRDPKYSPVSFSDGLLEIIGIRSTLHMAQIGAGLDFGVRLAQGCDIKIVMKRSKPPLPNKIDGEPWLQTETVVYQIKFLNQGRMLARVGSAGAFSKNAKKIGWLYKLCLSIRQWRLRYVIVTGGRLFYFLTAQDKKPLGQIILNEAQLTLSKKYRQCFKIITTLKTVYFSCKETKEPLDEWTKTLVEEGATIKDSNNSPSPRSSPDSCRASVQSADSTISLNPSRSQNQSLFSVSETEIFICSSLSSSPRSVHTSFHTISKNNNNNKTHRRSKSDSVSKPPKGRIRQTCLTLQNSKDDSKNETHNAVTNVFP